MLRRDDILSFFACFFLSLFIHFFVVFLYYLRNILYNFPDYNDPQRMDFFGP